MNTTTVYAPIVKHYRDDNGDLVVEGVATSPDLDLDQQICDPAWLKTAMPEWFTFGNIREQHSSIAAGVGTELEQVGEAWKVTSLVVDKGSAEKVEKKVLKGYSIGISNPRVVKDAAAPGGRIVGGSIVELSLVDRPCNPTAMLSLAKAAKPGMQVKSSAFDKEHMLIKVEEFAEIPENVGKPGEPEKPAPVDAKALVAARKAADPDLGKGSPAEDIAAAQAAIKAIAALVVSEAEGLAAGEMGESWDIQELLCAIDSLKWYICGERDEAENEPADALITIELADMPAATKTTEPAPVADPAEEDRLTKLEKRFTEVIDAAKEREKALVAELAKVKALPVPGGPVLTRTSEDTQKAASKDARLAQATKFRQMADAVSDPAARQGYLQLAAEADALA
jgi:hypothetical protein